MSKENSEKLKYVNIQLIAITLFVLALFLSYLINYDKKQELENKKRLFNNVIIQNLVKIQSTLVLLATITFLYINYNQYNISKKYNNDDINNLFMSTEVSILSVVGALIGIYIVFKSNNKLTIAETDLI